MHHASGRWMVRPVYRLQFVIVLWSSEMPIKNMYIAVELYIYIHISHTRWNCIYILCLTHTPQSYVHLICRCVINGRMDFLLFYRTRVRILLCNERMPGNILRVARKEEVYCTRLLYAKGLENALGPRWLVIFCTWRVREEIRACADGKSEDELNYVTEIIGVKKKSPGTSCAV